MVKPIMCDPSLFGKDLSDKVYIVTGANSGVGLATTRQLAKQGGKVILACRRIPAAEQVIQNLEQEGINSNLMKAMHLDLGSLASVRAFAAEFLKEFSQLHGLVNNAGISNPRLERTKEGFEATFGVNHCGHFLLTYLLLDVLKTSAPSRVVNVSSDFHYKAMGKVGAICFDDLNFTTRKYHPSTAYAQSKLANLLHAKELARRLEGTGVTAFSVHPGFVRSGMNIDNMPPWLQKFSRPILVGLFGLMEPWEGAQSSLHCLLDDNIVNQSGQLFSQIGYHFNPKYRAGGWPMESPNPQAHSEDVARKLWDETEQLVFADDITRVRDN